MTTTSETTLSLHHAHPSSCLPPELLLLTFANLSPSILISVIPLVSRYWSSLARSILTGGLRFDDDRATNATESEESPAGTDGRRGVSLTVDVEVVPCPNGSPPWIGRAELYTQLKHAPRCSLSPSVGLVALCVPHQVLAGPTYLSSIVADLAPAVFGCTPEHPPVFLPVVVKLYCGSGGQDTHIARAALQMFTPRCVAIGAYTLVLMGAHPVPETGAGGGAAVTAGSAALEPTHPPNAPPTAHTSPTHIDLFVVDRHQPRVSILDDLSAVFPSVRVLRVAFRRYAKARCLILFTAPNPVTSLPSVTSFTIRTGIGTLAPVSFLAFLSTIFATFPNLETLGAFDFPDAVWVEFPSFLSSLSSDTPSHPTFPTTLDTIALNLGQWSPGAVDAVAVHGEDRMIEWLGASLHALFRRLRVLQMIIFGDVVLQVSRMCTPETARSWVRAVGGLGLREVVLVGWPEGRDGAERLDDVGEPPKDESNTGEDRHSADQLGNSDQEEARQVLAKFAVAFRRECKEVGVKVVVAKYADEM